MEVKSIYEQFAKLFEYPGEDYHANAEQCLAALRRERSEAAASLEEFCASTRDLSTDDLRELFTRTFDLNPMCTLEIGWQLYGEDYQRGEFLVKMREELREADLRESGELPDHLSHALVLLAHLEPEEAAEFAGGYVIPALDKMRTTWREDRNAFAALLESAFLQLRSEYPYDPARMPVRKPELPILQ
ncbi:MAG TPA: nitrate reductase molybdenum cofactor assembly chaperone [Candidatus Acidoferrales bacterium]|nr:nitrate reductase molybdenum cofactor assembly chaperone [Candidatus Acidoferrales bacterium]